MPSRSSGARSHRHSDTQEPDRLIGEHDLHLLLCDKADPFVLVLDCIQDPHNLGACLRSADAAGVDAVIVPRDKAASITDVARRVACGAAATVPLARVTNLARTMRDLKDLGCWLVGTSDAATQNLYEVKLTGGLALVIGAEGAGMRRLTSDTCDLLINIPMAGAVPCLNASVATGVCLFEAVRQRRYAGAKAR